MVGGIAIETRLPAYVLRNLPYKVDCHFRTEVVLGMTAFVDAEACGEFLVAHISEIVGYGSKMDRTRHATLKPVDLVVHTERGIDVERREEARIHPGVVAAQSTHKLGTGYELECIIPMLGGLQSELAGVAYKVFGGTHRVEGVTTRVLQSETHLELVVPLEALLVVVIGL